MPKMSSTCAAWSGLAQGRRVSERLAYGPGSVSATARPGDCQAAPELIRRQPTDQRIDVFSYAVTCFELCTGRLPWEQATSVEAIMQHLHSPPADIRPLAPELDPSVAATIMRGLEVDRTRRWQSVREMTNAFREIRSRLEPDAT